MPIPHTQLLARTRSTNRKQCPSQLVLEDAAAQDNRIAALAPCKLCACLGYRVSHPRVKLGRDERRLDSGLKIGEKRTPQRRPIETHWLAFDEPPAIALPCTMHLGCRQCFELNSRLRLERPRRN